MSNSYDEFRLPTGEQLPDDPQQAVRRLQELLLLREAISQRARDAFTAQNRAEEQVQETQRQQKKMTQLLVGIVDELRRLIDEANRHTSADTADQSWLEAFGRLRSMALAKLEDSEIHHVPLLGQDLKTLTFAEQSVKSLVAVRNKSSDGQLIVKEEIRGLWVAVRNGKVVAVQGGEVTV